MNLDAVEASSASSTRCSSKVAHDAANLVALESSRHDIRLLPIARVRESFSSDRRRCYGQCSCRLEARVAHASHVPSVAIDRSILQSD